jgi:2-hydroxy-3-keto-5-methylthiopentenyl-1-phosphate phosphatase
MLTEDRSRARLVLDWDGTVTERDTLELVVESFGDIAIYRRTGEQMGAALTHDEALTRSFATVRAPLDAVVERLVSEVPIRPGFHEVVERERPLVVSSGFRELIEPILERERLDVELIANTVEPRPDGWRIRFRDLPCCPDCGEPCKRASLPPGAFVFAGDGYSDRCVALAAERVFATGTLAPWLQERGVAFEPFEDFHDLLAALDRELVTP